VPDAFAGTTTCTPLVAGAGAPLRSRRGTALVNPRPGRVHDQQRRTVERTPSGVPYGGAAHPPSVFEERCGFGVVRDQAPACRRCACGNHEPGVVGLRVVVQGRALQFLVRRPGSNAGGLASQPACTFTLWKAASRSYTHMPARSFQAGTRGAAVHREQNGRGCTRCGRCRAARDARGSPRTRGETRPCSRYRIPPWMSRDESDDVHPEIALVHHRRTKAPERRVAGDPRARDPAPDDETSTAPRPSMRSAAARVRCEKASRSSASPAWPAAGSGRFPAPPRHG